MLESVVEQWIDQEALRLRAKCMLAVYSTVKSIHHYSLAGNFPGLTSVYPLPASGRSVEPTGNMVDGRFLAVANSHS